VITRLGGGGGGGVAGVPSPGGRRPDLPGPFVVADPAELARLHNAPAPAPPPSSSSSLPYPHRMRGLAAGTYPSLSPD